MKTSRSMTLTTALILSSAVAAPASEPDDATLRQHLISSQPGLSESAVDPALLNAFRKTAAAPDDMDGQIRLATFLAKRGLWNLVDESCYFLRRKVGKERILPWYLSAAAARAKGDERKAGDFPRSALAHHPWNRWAWRTQTRDDTDESPWAVLDRAPLAAPSEVVTSDARFTLVAEGSACVRSGAELSQALNKCRYSLPESETEFGLTLVPDQRASKLAKALALATDTGTLPAWFLQPRCTLGGGFDQSNGMPVAFCPVHGTHYEKIRPDYREAPPLLSAVTVDDAVLGRAARSGDPVVRLGALEVLMRRDRTPAQGDAAAAAWVLASSPGRNFRLQALARILDGLRCNPMAHPELTKVLEETSRDGDADVRMLAALCLTWLDGRPRVLEADGLAVVQGLQKLVGAWLVGAPDLHDLWRLSRAGGTGTLTGDRSEP